MSAISIKRLEEIFDRIVGCSAAERKLVLEEVCAGDAILRAEVEALLRADQISPTLRHAERINGNSVENQASPSGASRTGENPGDVVGRYRLLERIGEGGFGVVFMAKQVDPVLRLVALKVIKLGMDTR